MEPARKVRVAVDVMGGDRGPSEVLDGVRVALDGDPALRVVVVGAEDVVAPFARTSDRIDAVFASQVIAMDESPARAVRVRDDSSMVVGCRLVERGEAEAFYTVGNTGAALTAALFTMKRIPGVQRPALAAVIPTGARPTVFLDLGANADCRPEHLVDFAHMGAALARTTLGVPDPSVALLSNGEEDVKGSKLVLEAHALMRRRVPGFVGNVEGRDVPAGVVDVIVTDGFTGNVALKLLEGTARTLLSQVRDTMTATLPARVAAMVLRGRLATVRDDLDPDRYGGVPLLGVRGVAIVGHGSAGAAAVTSGVRQAARAAREDLVGHIASVVSGR